MSPFFKVMHDTLKNTIVGTLSLCFNATSIIEKICWLLMGIIGLIGMSMIINDQLESWRMNPIVSSRKWNDLSEIPYPAVTFCHQGNTRMEIAERLLQAADPSSSKFKHLRRVFFDKSINNAFHWISRHSELSDRDLKYSLTNSRNFKRYRLCNSSSHFMENFCLGSLHFP